MYALQHMQCHKALRLEGQMPQLHAVVQSWQAAHRDWCCVLWVQPPAPPGHGAALLVCRADVLACVSECPQ